MSALDQKDTVTIEISGDGPPGPAGTPGAMGPQGPAGDPGLNWRGAWAHPVEYAVNDAVSRGGSSWICRLDHTSTTGDDPSIDNGTHWNLIAQKGDTGATGATGPQGPAGADGTNTAHGSLTGLANDDHTQYLHRTPANSTRNRSAPTASSVMTMDIVGAPPTASEQFDIFRIGTNGGLMLLRASHFGGNLGELIIPQGLLRFVNASGSLSSTLTMQNGGTAAAGSIDTSAASNNAGGSINTRAAAGGVGGAISTNAGTGGAGGLINTSGGNTAAGGAIVTANGGGQIDTAQGILELGIASQRSRLLRGSSSADHTLPSVTGELLSTAGVQTIVGNKQFNGASVQFIGNAELRFTGSSTAYVGFRAPTTVPANMIWRLPAADGTAGQSLATDGAGNLFWAASGLTALSSGMIFVGNASNVATPVAMSGDATLNNAGALTLVSVVTAAQYYRVTVDAKGRVIAGQTTIAHSELTGLVSGNDHTQYLHNAPSVGSSQNLIMAGLGNHVNLLVIQQSDDQTYPGLGTDNAYFGVWKVGGTVPAWMLFNNDGAFQQVRQSVPLRMLNAAGTHYVQLEVPSLATDVTFRLPPNNGTNGYVLTTNGAGVTSWAAASGGFTNPMTTQGDLILGGVSGAAGRLGIGANNTILLSNGTTASWANAASVKSALALNNVENTALSTWAGSSNLNTFAPNSVSLATLAQMATASFMGRNTGGTGNVEILSVATVRSMLSIGNVENTALSTWVGSSNLTTLGTIATGVWNGTIIGVSKGGTGVSLAATGGTGQVLRQSTLGGNVSVGTLGHSELTGLTSGNDHTQYLHNAPSSGSTQNVLNPGLANHLNVLVIQQSDDQTYPGLGTDNAYFGVWKFGGTVPAWMLFNNDGAFQQVRQSVPLRMYNPAGTHFVQLEVGTLTTDPTFRFPTTNGTNGYVLTTNGSGITSWTAPTNQTITLSGDISGSGTTAITTTIGANKVTLSMMAQMATASFLGRNTASTGNVEVLSTSTVKTMLGVNFADDETPSGSVNGSNVTFTLANTPISGSVKLYRNGMRMRVGASYDYTISGGTITFNTAPTTGDWLTCDYRY